MLAREGQLQILRGELDVDEPARGELQVPDVAVALFLGDERAHGARFLRGPGSVALPSQRPPHRRGDVGAETRIAGDEAGAGQRHMLPGLRLVLLVELERRELGRERSLAPGGPEPHVDLVEPARLGRRGQGRDQPLRQPRIVKRRAQPLPTVRIARVSGKIVDEDEVEIGGRGHLARAELAERDDRDPAAANGAVLGGEGLDDALEQRRDQPLRERAIGAAGPVGVEAPRQEIEPDMKHLLGGEVARPVQRVLEALPLRHERLDPRAHRGFVEARVEIDGPRRIDRGVEHMRPRRDHLREARGAAEHIAEQFA